MSLPGLKDSQGQCGVRYNSISRYLFTFLNSNNFPSRATFHQYLDSRCSSSIFFFLFFLFSPLFPPPFIQPLVKQELFIQVSCCCSNCVGVRILDGAKFIRKKVNLFSYNHSGSKMRRSVSCCFSPSVSWESQFMLSSLFITVGEGLRSSPSVYSVLGSLSQ